MAELARTWDGQPGGNPNEGVRWLLVVCSGDGRPLIGRYHQQRTNAVARMMYDGV